MNSTLQQLHQHSEAALTLIKPYYREAESSFIKFTSEYNFTAFLVVYSLVLIFLISKLTEKKRWRPKNKELKSISHFI